MRLPSDAKGYVVSISARVGLRRLHKLHACHRVPGIDYHKWEPMRDKCPSPDSYDSICKDCWRPSKGEAPGKEDSDSDDAGGSSTSSSDGDSDANEQ